MQESKTELSMHGSDPHQTFSASLPAETNMCGCDQHQPVNVSLLAGASVSGCKQHAPVYASLLEETIFEFVLHCGHPSSWKFKVVSKKGGDCLSCQHSYKRETQVAHPHSLNKTITSCMCH